MQQISKFRQKASQIDAQDIPQTYLCPLSKTIMQDPVIMSDGHSYQRSYIQQALKQKVIISQFTKKKLNIKNIQTNFALKNTIHQFVNKYEITKQLKEKQKHLLQDMQKAKQLQQQMNKKIRQERMSTPQCDCLQKKIYLKNEIQKQKYQNFQLLHEIRICKRKIEQEKGLKIQLQNKPKISQNQQNQDKKTQMESKKSQAILSFKVIPNRSNFQFKNYFQKYNANTQVCIRTNQSQGKQHFVIASNPFPKNDKQYFFSVKVLKTTNLNISIGVVTKENSKQQNHHLNSSLVYNVALDCIIYKGEYIQNEQKDKPNNLFDFPFEITVNFLKKQERIIWNTRELTLASFKLPSQYLTDEIYGEVILSHQNDEIQFI